MPDIVPALTDARETLFLALMALLMVSMVLLERRRHHGAPPPVPMLHPPRPLAGPLPWDGPMEELSPVACAPVEIKRRHAPPH